MKKISCLIALMLLCVLNIFAQAPDTLWSRSFGGSNKDVPFSIIETSDGGIAVAGITKSNNGDVFGHHGNQDVWIIKLNSEGDTIWTKTYGG